MPYSPAYTSPTDIANRALQHIGADHQLQNLISDQSKNQREVFLVYTKLRQAELRRNTWAFAIRRSVMRPIDWSTMAWTAPVWSSSNTYRVGQVVSYNDGYGTRLWVSVQPTNTNNTPGSSAAWNNYFGPTTAVPWVEGTGYFSGDMVYTDTGTGSYTVWTALKYNSTITPGDNMTWSSTFTYMQDDIVTYDSQNYISLVNLNFNNTPGSAPDQWATTDLTDGLHWVTQAGTLQRLSIVYPISAGPAIEDGTKNVFPLPYGWLRLAPQDPKAGSVSIFGAPTNRQYDDWLVEGDYLVSQDVQPINLRFVADVSYVPMFDTMFAEGLAARIALEICEALTQDTAKMKMVSALYTAKIRDARVVNGIENNAEEPALDDWISCRL